MKAIIVIVVAFTLLLGYMLAGRVSTASKARNAEITAIMKDLR